jgi:hypothetical protein
LTAKTSGISASPLAPSLPSPQCTTHNPTASWSAPMANFHGDQENAPRQQEGQMG